MRYLVGMFLVLALCAGCVSSTAFRSGSVQSEASGLGWASPVEGAEAHAIVVTADAQAGYVDARSDTERAWGETLREQPELVFDFLRDVAFPWRSYGYGQWGAGRTNPCYYGVCGQTVPVVPSGAPAGGVR